MSYLFLRWQRIENGFLYHIRQGLKIEKHMHTHVYSQPRHCAYVHDRGFICSTNVEMKGVQKDYARS